MCWSVVCEWECVCVSVYSVLLTAVSWLWCGQLKVLTGWCCFIVLLGRPGHKRSGLLPFCLDHGQTHLLNIQPSCPLKPLTPSVLNGIWQVCALCFTVKLTLVLVLNILKFKAALINVFISTMDKMHVCKVKGVLIMMNGQRIIYIFFCCPQLWSFLAYFSSLFWFSGLQF